MIHVGEGTFQLQSGDWVEIIVWSGMHLSYVSAWEKPIFTSPVARWFIERGAAEGSVTITMPDMASRPIVTIHDPLLALEFKMRWCTDRSRSTLTSYMPRKWVCCEEQRLMGDW